MARRRSHQLDLVSRSALARGARAALAVVAALTMTVSGVSLSANAAIVSKHEITANWQPVPANVLYGNLITAEWHLNTNDAASPESNEPVDNVRATLTATNGRFASLPTVCLTTGVTPVSAISSDGATLLCNLGTITAGTATVVQTPIRATSTTGGSVSAAGVVQSDSSATAAGPATLPPVPVTYNYGMDLMVSSPDQTYQGGHFMVGTVRKQRMQLDFAVAMNAGSRPGPANYSFTVNISSTTAGAVLTGINQEGCLPVGVAIPNPPAPGIPYSDPLRPDRTNFPGCTVTRLSATSYRVTLTGLDYSLLTVPVNDSAGNPLPGNKSFIASGALVFSNPYPVNVTTSFRYAITAPAWTYPGTTTTTVDPVANNVDTVMLYAPGQFSNRWAGSPTGGRSPWDDQLFVSAGTSQGVPLPAANGVAAGNPLPLYSQASSLAWNAYTGAGGANMAGLCTMNQSATSFPAPESNNFVLTHMDAGGWDGAAPAANRYINMPTARYWYTTANINTKTFLCNSTAVTWTQITPPAGTTFRDPRETGSNVMTLPANVSAIKITWNPAVDKPYQVLIRGFGHIKANAAPSTANVTGEVWTVGSFNDRNGIWYNASNGGSVATATPWSRYVDAGGGTNGYRDVARIVGNRGAISKSASPLTARPGVPVTYTVRAQTQSTTTPPSAGNFTVVDTLPLGMSYVGGSATVDGVALAPTITPATATVGQKLTWSFTAVPANTNKTIVYQAMLPTNSTVAPGSTLTNTAVVNVPGDLRDVTLRDASASVVVPNNGATTMSKSSADSYLAYAGDSSSWTITVNSFDPSSNAYTDTIDILPYAGDDRGTNIDGGYTIGAVTVPNATTWRVYYTTANPATLSDDPRTASNGTAPGAITGNTVGWTLTKPANPTAIRVIGPALAPGVQQSFSIAYTTLPPTGENCEAPAAGDNKPGQVIVNSALSYAGHTRLPMQSSAFATIADCNEVQIKKYVLAKGGDPQVEDDWHDAESAGDYPQYSPGDPVPFRLTVTNKGTGTLTNLVVTDPLYPQCAYTIASLDAGASASNFCVNPTAPIGTTVNTATVNVVPPLGAALSDSDVAGFVVPEPPRVVKTADPASGSTVEPGDVITYSVTITEPETSPAPFLNPSLVDALADVLDDATLVGSPTVSTDVDGGDPGTAAISGTTLTWAAPILVPGQSITISYSVRVNDPATGNDVIGNHVTPGVGIECDVCTTEHVVPDIEFVKTANPTVATPGGVVTYTITATNTGAVDYTSPGYPASFTDDLTDVLLDSDYVTDSVTGGATFDGTSIAWSGALAVGATATFTYQVQVRSPNPGDNRLENTVESDTPGSNCVEGSTDPNCDAVVLVQSYTVEKATAEEPVIRGEVVTYTISVTNTGAVAYSGVGGDVASFEDDLTDVLDDASYNGDASGGATLTGSILSWAGALPVGATLNFTYTVTVRLPSIGGDDLMDNVVVPTGPGGSCAGPGECDTSTPIAMFHVEKTTDVTSAVQGDTVHYTITVTNPGQVDFTDGFPASFTDSFTGIIDDGDLPREDDGSIVPGSIIASAGTASYTAPTLSWSGPIARGDTVTIEYDVLIDNPTLGDHRLINRVTTPPGLANCDTDPGPECGTDTPIASYRVVKDADQTVVEEGDTIVYTLTITNTGQVDYAPLTVNDDLSDVLDNAENLQLLSGDAAFDAGTSTLSWTGDLAIGETHVITYSVEVSAGVDENTALINTVTTPTPGGNCPPSGPYDRDEADPACYVELPERSFIVAKSANTDVALEGDTITYTITITNTGSEDYDGSFPAILTDSLAGVLDDTNIPATDAFITSRPSTGTTTWDPVAGTIHWEGPLAVGATEQIVYELTVNQPDTGDHLLRNTVRTPPGIGGNCTEASSDPNCRVDIPVMSFTVEKAVDRTVTQADGTVVYTILVKNTGQVDYTDVDGMRAGFVDDLSDVLDDATFGTVVLGGAVFEPVSQELSWSGALAIGGTVTIRYTVITTADGNDELINGVQPVGPGGSCAADGACETLVLVRSYELTKTADPDGSTIEGGIVEYTVTVTNTGAVPYLAGDPAGFSDDLSNVLDDADYNGDVAVEPDGSGTATVTGAVLRWSGPLALGEVVTITYSVTVHSPNLGDHYLNNVITPTPGTGGECDVCGTSTPVRSFLVAKTVDVASTIQGGTVTYTITVTNTGVVDYTDGDPASFTDDLTEVIDDAAFGALIAVSAGSADFDSPELSWSGPLPAGGTATVQYTVVVNDPIAPSGDFVLDNVVTVPAEDGGKCDPCTTRTPVQAFTTVKTADKAVVVPGEVVTYTVRVTNTGQVAYADPNFAIFTDDLSGVLDDATYNSDATAGATFDTGTQVLTWQGPLPIGAMRIITYSVTVLDPAGTSGDAILRNAVLNPPGIGGSCTDPDDPGCSVDTLVRTLHVQKVASEETVLPGGTVHYTITVENTGSVDFTAGDPAIIRDNLAAVLDDGELVLDSITNGATYAAPVLTWSGPLAAGEIVTIEYDVVVDNPVRGDHRLVNPVTTPPGIHSNCLEGSTDPACVAETLVKAFLVEKSADRTTVLPGDIVEYTITVRNTGQVDYTDPEPAAFTDDLSEVLDDAVYNDDASAGATYSDPVLSWSGELAVGQTIEITYTVTVNDPLTGDRILYNRVVTPPDRGGNCEAASSDPQCEVTIGGPSLHVVKTSSETEVFPGETVEYEITVTNDGGIDFTVESPAAITDDLSAVLDDAVYNGDATNGAMVTGTQLTWTGPLAVGDSVTITYSVTVAVPASGDGIMDNVVTTPPGIPGNCRTVEVDPDDPSGPTESTDPDCSTRTLVKKYTTVKVSDATANVKPGDVVTYTVTVTNTGQLPYTADEPATFSDDFSGVLDDATFLGDATGNTAYVDPMLTWSGPLEVGETIWVTYSFRINPEGGDNALRNAVLSESEIGGSCDVSEDAGCDTLVAIDRPLALTGMTAAPVAGLVATLLGLGGLLFWIDRRRRVGDSARQG